MIFAAKTTLSGLIALLVAFTFNLDQPQWALLTVFIVAQPQSGLVLAKSFYRIIGTFTGAAVALLLVSLFAQERVLFLGALALWIGLCTFGSQYARNFTAYGFVLSGYTAAIVGIPGALSNWPHGSTAAILAAVATARLATMGHAVPISLAATLIFGLATIPAFLVVDVLLPQASGFEMFALIVAPAIFCCALLMAHQKTLLIGYLSGLLFASVGQFQNRMAYDPVGLINTSIAAVCAVGTALVLWSVLAPEDTQAACSRFLRVVRQALARLTEPGRRIGLAEFETTITEALDQLQSHLRPDRPDDIAAFEAGIAFLGAGRKLIRSPDGGGTVAAFAPPGGWDGGPSKHRATFSVAEHRKGALHDAS